jgi:precorrin-2 dehydrogenase/sirohydrochlorin ferrochelatase
MRTHPVFLCLEGRRCVVIGGDAAAAAKVAACVRAGGQVTVVAARLAPEIAALVASGKVRHLDRRDRPGDLAGAFLAYASVRGPGHARRLAAEAERERVLLNVIDMPRSCSFIAPAVVERGALQVAVGTGGASPGLSARLRRQLEEQLGVEYGPFVAILGAVRRALADDPERGADRRAVLGRLLASPLLDLLRAGRRDAVEALLAELAGERCTLERLGVDLALRE